MNTSKPNGPPTGENKPRVRLRASVSARAGSFKYKNNIVPLPIKIDPFPLVTEAETKAFIEETFNYGEVSMITVCVKYSNGHWNAYSRNNSQKSHVLQPQIPDTCKSYLIMGTEAYSRVEE